MAEQSTLSRASIFEIVSHEAVAAVFKPAFHYILKILVKNYPEKLAFFSKYADEVYMVCDLILQRYYLTYYNASISENFYYLKRVDDKGRPLSERLKILSLLSLVIVPYIKSKVDKVFEYLREKTIREESSQQGLLKMAFLRIYPYIHCILHAPVATYQLGYILHLLPHHNPLFHFFKIQLVRARKDEMVSTLSDLFPSTSSRLQKLLFSPVFILDKLIKFISLLMPAVIFFLQFLDWWYSTEHQATNLATSLPTPPPPRPPEVSNNGHGLPDHPLQCPLCHKVRTNMAALVSSGFVFCYACIYQYISQHGVCPVTQTPSSLDQVLRIYSPQGK